MPSSLRNKLLDFLTHNPTAWRTQALAVQFGVDMKSLRLELSRLSAEGKVVSCTVTVPGVAPQQEYRIATNVRKFNSNRFVISRESGARHPRMR